MSTRAPATTPKYVKTAAPFPRRHQHIRPSGPASKALGRTQGGLTRVCTPCAPAYTAPGLVKVQLCTLRYCRIRMLRVAPTTCYWMFLELHSRFGGICTPREAAGKGSQLGLMVWFDGFVAPVGPVVRIIHAAGSTLDGRRGIRGNAAAEKGGGC